MKNVNRTNIMDIKINIINATFGLLQEIVFFIYNRVSKKQQNATTIKNIAMFIQSQVFPKMPLIV